MQSSLENDPPGNTYSIDWNWVRAKFIELCKAGNRIPLGQ